MPVIAACGADLRHATVVASMRWLRRQDGRLAMRRRSALPDADAPFAIMYTSGTTGRPKGVIVSHRMLRLSGEAAALVSAARRRRRALRVGAAVPHRRRADDRAAADPQRDAGAWPIASAPAASGPTCSACGATHMHFLGGILQILLKQPPGAARSRARRAHRLGRRVPDAMSGEPFEARFGVEIRECYGMTECSSFTTANLDGTVGSVGKPMPWFDVALVDRCGPAGGGRRAGRDGGAGASAGRARRADTSMIRTPPPGPSATALSTPAIWPPGMPPAICTSTAA